MARALWVTAAAGLWATTTIGCGAAGAGDGGGAVGDREPTESESSAIKGGGSATDYPESLDLLVYSGGVLKGACSGTLVAPKVVLTAGHCVTGYDGWKASAPFAGGQSATGEVAATTYSTSTTSLNNVSKDLGLIFLDSAIAIAHYPILSSAPLAYGASVQNIGRIDSGTYTDSAFLSRAVPAYPGTSRNLPYDYIAVDNIEPGDSGGAVIAAGTHTIVAVNSGTDGTVEALARVDIMYDSLEPMVQRQGP